MGDIIIELEMLSSYHENLTLAFFSFHYFYVLFSHFI